MSTACIASRAFSVFFRVHSLFKHHNNARRLFYTPCFCCPFRVVWVELFELRIIFAPPQHLLISLSVSCFSTPCFRAL